MLPDRAQNRTLLLGQGLFGAPSGDRKPDRPDPRAGGDKPAGSPGRDARG